MTFLLQKHLPYQLQTEWRPFLLTLLAIFPHAFIFLLLKVRLLALRQNKLSGLLHIEWFKIERFKDIEEAARFNVFANHSAQRIATHDHQRQVKLLRHSAQGTKKVKRKLLPVAEAFEFINTKHRHNIFRH